MSVIIHTNARNKNVRLIFTRSILTSLQRRTEPNMSDANINQQCPLLDNNNKLVIRRGQGP